VMTPRTDPSVSDLGPNKHRGSVTFMPHTARGNGGPEDDCDVSATLGSSFNNRSPAMLTTLRLQQFARRRYAPPFLSVANSDVQSHVKMFEIPSVAFKNGIDTFTRWLSRGHILFPISINCSFPHL
jgi:hypothetical protein